LTFERAEGVEPLPRQLQSKEGARSAGEHIHQSALADRQAAEQFGECLLLQSLIGQSLTGLQIDRQRVGARVRLLKDNAQ